MSADTSLATIAALLGLPPYNEAAGEKALDLLPGLCPSERPRLHAWFAAISWRFRAEQLGNAARPRAVEIVDAIRSAAAAARQMDAALSVLQRARLTAREGASASENCRRFALPSVVDAVQAGFRLERAEWHGGYEDPLSGAFDRIASAIEDLGSRFTREDFREPTRPDHPGLVDLIVGLAEIWREMTGKRASAHKASGTVEYVPPFVRFVRAYAPIADVPPDLSAKTVARILSHSPRLRKKFDAIRGNDIAPGSCQSSGQQIET